MEHTSTKTPFHGQHLLLHNCKLFLSWPSWNNVRRLLHHFLLMGLISPLWGICMTLAFVIALNWFYSAAPCWERCTTATQPEHSFRAKPPASSHNKAEPFPVPCFPSCTTLCPLQGCFFSIFAQDPSQWDYPWEHMKLEQPCFTAVPSAQKRAWCI